MRGLLILVLVGVICIGGIGCSKKEKPQEAFQDVDSMLQLSALKNESNISITNVINSTGDSSLTTTQNSKNLPLPPQGPYSPTAVEIQTALRNAKFYTGKIDGKIGPVTKKAIEEFQKANNLKIDGKVGPKTWKVLSTYLNSSSSQAVTDNQ